MEAPATTQRVPSLRRLATLTNHLQPSGVSGREETGNRVVCIVGAARTPLGAFQGALQSLTAPQLGAVAIKSALAGAGVAPELVQEVYMGNVLSAGVGQAPARQAALAAGLPKSTPCTTVNKVCASGMKAIVLGAQAIQTGYRDVVVVGGMESMSNAPYYLTKARQGYRMGSGEVTDGMIKDGLWDPYNDVHMGNAAELCADKHGISRQEQDEYAISSYQRAIQASQAGWFDSEIAPITVKGKSGKSVVITKDEEVDKVKFDKIPQLKSPFKANGTVTAANSSAISDGATALVLMSEEKAKELGVQVLAKIKGFADAAQDPLDFPTAPALAIPLALRNSRLSKDQVDLYEINEAFSVVVLANMKLLHIERDRINVNGGAVSMGHPIGCSGARIVVTLLSGLQRRQQATTSVQRGVAAVCNGGGGATALVIETCNSV
ncbi:Acetyl-CoA acetyltransferase 2 [Balamuthia mandrillaris]